MSGYETDTPNGILSHTHTPRILPHAKMFSVNAAKRLFSMSTKESTRYVNGSWTLCRCSGRDLDHKAPSCMTGGFRVFCNHKEVHNK